MTSPLREPNNYKINTDIRFSGIDSYDPDGDIIRYIWIVDGKTNPNDSSVITKNFQSSGNHEIILIVYDNRDAIGKTTLSITVNDEDEIPWIPIVGAVVAVGVVGVIATEAECDTFTQRSIAGLYYLQLACFLSQLDVV